MGKVISLKNHSFKREGAHALKVYLHNIDNPEVEDEPQPTDNTEPSKGFVPFGQEIPKDWTLAGAMSKIKPRKK